MTTQQQLTEAKAGLAYVQNVLAANDLQQWERNEYEAVAKEYQQEIEQLTAHIQQNAKYFA